MFGLFQNKKLTCLAALGFCVLGGLSLPSAAHAAETTAATEAAKPAADKKAAPKKTATKKEAK